MENLEDNFLIKNVKENLCSDSLSELINRHSGICIGICNKYFPSGSSSSSIDSEEIKAHKDLLIYQAVKSFDEEKGAKFSTWLGNLTNYACLNICGKKNKFLNLDLETINFIIDQNSQNEGGYTNSIQDEFSLIYIKEMIDSFSDEDAKNVIKLRYFSDSDKVMSFKDIAEKLNISIQTAINWHNKILNILRKKIDIKNDL